MNTSEANLSVHPDSDPRAAMQELALDVVRTLRAAGYRALWAGGCVRDRLLGRSCKDIDVATSARPERVMELFPGARGVGKVFGVVLVDRDGCVVEVATFRRDLGYEDGRHPVAVEFSDEQEDARRRDFTINGMFWDPLEQRLVDYVGGRDDLDRRVVRAIGTPSERFEEDRLRLLRAVRFAATLDFELDPATESAVRAAAGRIHSVSMERVQLELTRMLVESARPGQALQILDRTGLLKEILPEVSALHGVEQPPEFHPEGDVFTHTVLMLDALRVRTPETVYAVLMHDIAKPACAEWKAGPDGRERWRFHGHDARGADLAEDILRRLKMPNRLIEIVSAAVRRHMRFIHATEMSESRLRRWMAEPAFEVELELHRVDCLCSHGDLSIYEQLFHRWEALRNEPVLPTPLVRGRDILDLGIPEGPGVGRWVRAAFDRQMDRGITDREELLGWLKDGIAAGDGGTKAGKTDAQD